jgi:hypothetical protein
MLIIIKKIQQFRQQNSFRWSLIKTGCLFTFVLCALIVIVLQCDSNEFKAIEEREKQYFEINDYYIEGKIIQCEDYNGNQCAIHIKIDSILLGKTNNDFYIGYINKDSTEVIIYALFVSYVYNNKIKNENIKVILDSRKDYIYYFIDNKLIEEHSIAIIYGQWLEKFEKTIQKWDLNLDNSWIKF